MCIFHSLFDYQRGCQQGSHHIAMVNGEFCMFGILRNPQNFRSWEPLWCLWGKEYHLDSSAELARARTARTQTPGPPAL